MTNEMLNESAMKIIMLAGDARNAMTEAIKSTFDGASYEDVDNKIQQGKGKIAEAHHIQTEIIQSTFEEKEAQSTLLFSHAQDTLMTVYSEANMLGYMIEMYRRLDPKAEQ